MAYYRRRRFSKRRAFSKRQERAIEAISRGPVETKEFVHYLAPGSYLPLGVPVVGVPNIFGAAAGRYAFNIHSYIPRVVTLNAGDAVAVSSQVVGDEFYSIGVAIDSQIAWAGTKNWRIRISVVSASFKDSIPPTTPLTITNTNYNWMKEDTNIGDPTFQAFSANVNVLRQVTYSSSIDGATARHKRLWCPITGRKKLSFDDVDTNELWVYSLTGKNYFIIFEWIIPGWTTYTPTQTDYLSYRSDVKVYFKDP